ncbi:NAD(P)/FAD-dependent oxidoreductase [Caldinitratiruptor microaerophilus]|uniref:FAD-dependent oxidoreductase n=1 Tax=Caldinitratiruptor microaerophilus TaxID=671077 RepID=A0AA35G5J5_9FIRM|nr:FAD-dependent oxidoreductase [Caldinitratiruptor microaerophilus]BDG59521.1 FAD-dependent oxidoreductase [Caldinitratiruptor microaerophilus]
MDRADVVIVGGGIIGMSIAYHLLKRAPRTRVVVLEKEESPGLGATSKATGGIRHQFSTAVNVKLTLLSLPEYENFEQEFGVDIGLVKNGYLFVTAQESVLGGLKEAAALQRSLGVPAEVLAPADLARLLPAMRHDDLVGGTVCWQDGTADPHSALQGYWRRVRDLGGEVRTGWEVTGFRREGAAITTVETTAGPVAAGVVVNAAGPYAGVVGRMAGVEVPVEPYRRSVFVARPLPALDRTMPLVVDMDTGWYIHRQHGSGHLLLGGTDKVTHPGFSTEVDWADLQRVLEAGLRRFPVLAEAEIQRAYAGLREITPDFHCILGPAPEVPNFYLACGFSGHGFMHAPAAGRLTAELILDGAARSLDVTPLGLERFHGGEVHAEAATF